MNNMGMEGGLVRNEPDNQSSGKASAKIVHKTAAAAFTFRRGNKDPYYSDSDPAHHCYYFVQGLLEALLDKACAASAVGYGDPLLSPGINPYFSDIFSVHSRRLHGLHGRTFQTATSQQFKFNQRRKLFECVGKPMR